MRQMFAKRESDMEWNLEWFTMKKIHNRFGCGASNDAIVNLIR